MENIFNTIDPKLLQDNPFKMLDDDWMLVTSGTKESYNMMTASWGGFGILWNKPVVFVFVRPTRHTFEFTEKNRDFTLNFFEEKHRNILKICGSKSGKNINKMQMEGLTPLSTKNESIYFQEARLVLNCRKLYSENIKEENFISHEALKNYPLKDFHKMYIAEITECWLKK